MSTSSRHFKARYWFNAVLFRSLSMTLNNVWCIRKYFNLTESIAELRETIAKELFEEFEEAHVIKNKCSAIPYIPIYNRDRGEMNKIRLENHRDHWPDKRRGQAVRCTVCKSGTSVFFCRKCNVHLHIGQCYVDWHTKVDV